MPIQAEATVPDPAPATADPAPELVPDDSLSVPPAAVPAVHAVEEHTMATISTDFAKDAADKAAGTAQATASTMHDAAATAADRGRALYADWNSRTKEAMDRGAKAFEQLGDFYKGHLAALMESSRIAAKGWESFGQHAAELTRKSLEDATSTTKTLSQSKSPTEFMKLQGDYARSTFDTMVAETSRSTEAAIKLAGDVAQPVANRLAVAADHMKAAA